MMRWRQIALLVVAVAAITATPVTASAADSPVQARIVGGTEAPAGSWPAMAGLVIVDGNSEVRCGGTLIAPTVVLTAAHCLTQRQALNVASSLALIGGGPYEDASSSGTPWASASTYGATFPFDDVALIQLATPSANTPMPLLPSWRDSQLVEGVLLEAAGYGQVVQGPNAGQYLAPVLLQARLPYLDDTTCENSYGPAYVGPSILCAGYGGSQVISVCYGDSGGPLTLNVDGARLLVGSTTYVGPNCYQEFPQGFGRISAFRSWILTAADAANAAPHTAVREWLSTQAATVQGLTVENTGPDVTLRWTVTPANWTTSGFTTTVNGSSATTTDATLTRTVTVSRGGPVDVRVTPIVELGTAEPATFSGTPTPTRVPVVTAAISGVPRAGAALQATAAPDDPWASTPTLQWTWNDEPIRGATGPTYTPTRAQMGGRIAVIATSSNALGAATGKARTATLVSARPRTVATTTPTYGTARVGGRLRVTAPSATGFPQPRVTYQWLRDGRAIDGATTASYRVRAADRDRRLVCRITYGNKAGSRNLASWAVLVR